MYQCGVHVCYARVLQMTLLGLFQVRATRHYRRRTVSYRALVTLYLSYHSSYYE